MRFRTFVRKYTSLYGSPAPRRIDTTPIKETIFGKPDTNGKPDYWQSVIIALGIIAFLSILIHHFTNS